jgi:hypothetical protein
MFLRFGLGEEQSKGNPGEGDDADIGVPTALSH